MSNSRHQIDGELVEAFLLEAVAPIDGAWTSDIDGDTVNLHRRPAWWKEEFPMWVAWVKVDGPILEIHTKCGGVPRINLADPNSATQILEFFKSYFRE